MSDKPLPNVWIDFNEADGVNYVLLRPHPTCGSFYIPAEKIRELRNLVAADESELLNTGANLTAGYAKHIRLKLEKLIGSKKKES